MDFTRCLLVSLVYCVVAKEHRPINQIPVYTLDTSIEDVRFRLPNNTKPFSYDITIVTKVDEDDFNFSGRVKIDLHVLETSSKIVLHARQLTIKSINLTMASGFSIELNSFTYDATTEFLTISTEIQLLKDAFYSLIIDYVGELRTDQFGFYRSSYVNSRGEKKWLAATQFEPADARHAFPCFDEPALKAQFTIHIEHGESYHALSNMREQRRAAFNGRVITDFDQTPLISTYLIAFIVSDFEYREFIATKENPTAQRVFTIKEYVNQTSYALTEAINILKAIENYLQVPFTLSKLDHASIPDTRVGAMENWGLITYPDRRLLFDSTVHLAFRQQDLTTTIAHELSHQWFGNLVSPKWWSYLWLNEGFATLFQTLATDLVRNLFIISSLGGKLTLELLSKRDKCSKVHPEWKVFHHFIVTEVQVALRSDVKRESHPLTYYVESPVALENLFDDITYSKGGSVIRMFMHAIGEKTFRKGLNYYLTNNSYGVVDDDSLFERFEAAIVEDKALPSNFHFKNLFGSWSNQKGFPLLTVTRNYTDGSVTLYQEKYNVDFQAIQNDSSSWWIPFNFASARDPTFNVTTPFSWLSKGQQKTVITPKQSDVTWNNDDWLIFNRQQTGYYRILYDEQNYHLINKQLNDGHFNEIHPINRAQILDDLHEFVSAGRISAEYLCNTLTYLKNETSYAPWETAKKIINEWHQNLQISNKLPNFKTFVSGIVSTYYDKWTLIENEKESVFEKLLRNTAVNLACEFGVSTCLNDTYLKFKEMISDKKVSPNIRGLAVNNGVRSASNDEIAKLWQILLKSPYSDERKEIISSIGNIPNESTKEFYLKQSINDFGVNSFSATERLLLVTTVINSGHKGVELAIKFVLKDIGKVNVTIGSMSTILKSIAGRILDTKIETRFHQLLSLAKQKSLVTDKDVEVLKRTATDKLQWQNNHLIRFEKHFFIGKCAGSGATILVALPTLLFLSVCIIFINIE